MAAPASATRRRIADLSAGLFIDGDVFLIKQKALRTTSNGGLYIHAVLVDSSGQMLARMWNASQGLFDSIPEGAPVAVRGRVETYKGALQFIMEGVRALEPGSVNLTDFLPKSQHEIEPMWTRVKEILRTVRNPHLLALLGRFLNDGEFAEQFKRAPAARTNHHAFLGGLLEHTLSLMELALVVLPRYPQVDRDLVLAGLFLHDAGKTAELSCNAGFDYTNDGQLIGHIVRACIWIEERAREITDDRGAAFPRDLLHRLTHIIVAHHGKYEFGSPKLPATAEAFMVHYLDNLDAKLNMVFTAIAADPDESSEWTQWINALETRVYKGSTTRQPDA